MSPHAGPRFLMMPALLATLTIFAIAGTLTACGRYGRPVRPVPDSELRLDVVHAAGPGSQDGFQFQDRIQDRFRDDSKKPSD